MRPPTTRSPLPTYLMRHRVLLMISYTHQQQEGIVWSLLSHQ